MDSVFLLPLDDAGEREDTGKSGDRMILLSIASLPARQG